MAESAEDNTSKEEERWEADMSLGEEAGTLMEAKDSPAPIRTRSKVRRETEISWLIERKEIEDLALGNCNLDVNFIERFRDVGKWISFMQVSRHSGLNVGRVQDA